jgi:RING finger protein 113A
MFESERSGQAHQYGGGAFATLDVDGTAPPPSSADGSESKVDDLATKKLYRGMAQYTDYRDKPRDDSLGLHGPLRAPTNVRGICRIDYQPDLCKDFKETGYCGFGDSCKFLHDRSEYKGSWKIEQEWQAKQHKKQQRLVARLAAGGSLEDAEADAAEEAEDAAEEARRQPSTSGSRWQAARQRLVPPKSGAPTSASTSASGSGSVLLVDVPFACFICRKAFLGVSPSNEDMAPVQTQCGHYFHSACALKRYGSDPRCAACNTQTFGIFNAAPKLLDVLRARGEAAGARPTAVS